MFQSGGDIHGMAEVVLDKLDHVIDGEGNQEHEYGQPDHQTGVGWCSAGIVDSFNVGIPCKLMNDGSLWGRFHYVLTQFWIH